MSDRPERPAGSGLSESRRTFLKTTGLTVGAGLAGKVGLASSVYAGGSDVIKVGLVGCGGRGSGAAVQTLRADPQTELIAVADAFEDNLQSGLKHISRVEDTASRVKVPKENQFVGLESYKQLLQTDVDLVLLATPPHFRPIHIRACVDVGKHVFAEKPAAVDGPGVRSVLESTRIAKDKGLSFVSGLCWRYETGMQQTIEQLQSGIIGQPVYLQSVRYSNGVEKGEPRQPGWSDMYHQVRNWYYYTWLSGDFNVEQFVHEMDKISWLMGDTYPVRCISTGGRETRTEEKYGNIFDHFATIFEYENGVRYYATTRHQRGCEGEFHDNAFFTGGSCEMMKYDIKDSSGATVWRRRERKTDMHQLEHNAMYEALRSGRPINAGEYLAKSTLLGIMARMSAYTGQSITWDEALNSQESLSPSEYSWDAEPPAKPIAVPGVTRFV